MGPGSRLALALTIVALGLSLVGCRRSLPATDCAASPPTGPGQSVCTVPGFDDRAFILRLPPAFAPGKSLPVVIALHGGGGHKEGLNPLTCEDGDESAPSCLASAAAARGVILVVPDGTVSTLARRTWNAGGDGNGAVCLDACTKGVDDLAYLRALIAHVQSLVSIDARRIYVTGFSDGASMSHRVACELSDVVAAIAPVSGANQFVFGGGTCAPTRPVPVLDIHGDADPCWPFNGGAGTCPGQPEGTYADVVGTIVGTTSSPGWARRNGCSLDPTIEALPDPASDGTTASRQVFAGCEADVELITINGGGHTWPGGDQYLAESFVGKVSRDLRASDRVLDFLLAHPMP